tara:strand:+ start:733 stop:993 length:261 start_codon:yes stop_codon:yes gene_type:complete
MAYKSTGKAAKSATGASMSKYDVEVEARLQALEAAVASLQSAPTTSAGSASDSDVNTKLDSLIFALSHAQGVKQHIQHLHGDLQQY